MAPTIVKRSPELLLALSSRIRHLLFAVPAGINPVSYSVIGFARLFAAGALCYALGHGYGNRGMRWVERQFADQTPATFRWMQRGADRFGPLLVVVMPGSNIVCALVGYRRMRPMVFAACLSVGIAVRLAWVWVAAKQFEDQLKVALDWIEQYQWWLVGGFFASRSCNRGGAPPPRRGRRPRLMPPLDARDSVPTWDELPPMGRLSEPPPP